MRAAEYAAARVEVGQEDSEDVLEAGGEDVAVHGRLRFDDIFCSWVVPLLLVNSSNHEQVR